MSVAQLQTVQARERGNQSQQRSILDINPLLTHLLSEVQLCYWGYFATLYHTKLSLRDRSMHYSSLMIFDLWKGNILPCPYLSDLLALPSPHHSTSDPPVSIPLHFPSLQILHYKCHYDNSKSRPASWLKREILSLCCRHQMALPSLTWRCIGPGVSQLLRSWEISGSRLDDVSQYFEVVNVEITALSWCFQNKGPLSKQCLHVAKSIRSFRISD